MDIMKELSTKELVEYMKRKIEKVKRASFPRMEEIYDLCDCLVSIVDRLVEKTETK